MVFKVAGNQREKKKRKETGHLQTRTFERKVCEIVKEAGKLVG